VPPKSKRSSHRTSARIKRRFSGVCRSERKFFFGNLSCDGVCSCVCNAHCYHSSTYIYIYIYIYIYAHIYMYMCGQRKRNRGGG
jgi:hypothetical protein